MWIICFVLCQNYLVATESTTIATLSTESTATVSTDVESTPSPDCTLLPQETNPIATTAKAANKIFFILSKILKIILRGNNMPF